MKCKKCGAELLFENEAHGMPFCQGNLSDGAMEEGTRQHLNYLSKAKTAVINGSELTVLPYGWLAQATTESFDVGVKNAVEKVKKDLEDNVYIKAINWILSDDTGMSSKVIWGVMMKAEKYYSSYTPSDPSDFGRCYRLLKLIQEWEDRLEELRIAGEKWGIFVDNYKKMCELYEEEKDSGVCRKLYNFMQEIL